MKKRTSCPSTLSLFDGKRCKDCGQWKPFDDYTKETLTGRHIPYCKPCCCIRTKSRYVQKIRVERPVEPFRVCNRCGETKPLEKFKKDPRMHGGRTNTCTSCFCKSRLNYLREYLPKWRQTDKGREVMRTAAKEFHRKNPHKNAEYRHNRDAMLLGNGGTFTADEWQSLCEFYGNRCLCCGESKPLTVDHVIPLSKGGVNSIDNIQPLCYSCNSRKHVKHVDYRNAAK